MQLSLSLALHLGGKTMVRLSPVLLLLWLTTAARADDNAPFRVEARQRLQQSGRIGGVAFTPDGKTVVVGDSRGKLGFWSCEAGKLYRPLRELSVGIGAVAVSPNGRSVALGMADGTIRLWEMATDKERAVLKGHDDDVRALAFSPDGTQLISGSNDQTVRLWDVSSGSELRRFEGHKSWIQAVVWAAADGKTIASGSRDQTARLWDVATGKELRRFATEDNQIWAVALTPDGGLLAAGGGDFIVRVWNTRTGKQVRELKGHTARVWTLAFSPDGRLLVSGGEDMSARLWETVSGQGLPPLNDWASPALTSAFSPRQQLLAIGGEGGNVVLWDVSFRRGRAEPLAGVELETLWSTLGSNDVGRALRDMARLTDAPKDTVAFLQDHLQPVPHVAEDHVARLIADLDSGKFAVRQKATKELEMLAEAAEASLRKALADKPSLELQNRLNDLLKPLETLLPPPERLRALRAIQVLEEIGSREALHVLENVSKGEPAAQVTQEAKTAVQRLKERGRGP
jgi:WD40 repeat protein